MTIKYNRTSRNIVVLAKSKTDRVALQRMIADMNNQGRKIRYEESSSAVTLYVPVIDLKFVAALEEFISNVG